ncbi:unnamed protein product [Periconia digitata]|uniref:Uncharacterized protein n=1 Tax=Periconia digitata TaxID=1303443 RepID=A0A9W4URS1_9PLEO|nr:unnamed protein product [Periconia digitata]
MVSIRLVRAALAASILSVTAAQASVPKDLSAGFEDSGVELQASFTGSATEGFKDGSTFTKDQVGKVPAFALGDSSGISTTTLYTVLMVDTTQDNARILHYARANFKVSSIVNIESQDDPLLAYKAPGAFGETGDARKYTFLLYKNPQRQRITSLDLPEEGKPFDIKKFQTDNGLPDPGAGLGMTVNLGGGSGEGSGAGDSPSSSSSAAGGERTSAANPPSAPSSAAASSSAASPQRPTGPAAPAPAPTSSSEARPSSEPAAPSPPSPTNRPGSQPEPEAPAGQSSQQPASTLQTSAQAPPADATAAPGTPDAPASPDAPAAPPSEEAAPPAQRPSAAPTTPSTPSGTGSSPALQTVSGASSLSRGNYGVFAGVAAAVAAALFV